MGSTDTNKMNGDDGSDRRELAYSWHALFVMAERDIRLEWVELIINEPALRIVDLNDSEIERFYGAIPERQHRVLRVAVNTQVAPWRVVSVFFDRRMRGRI